MCIGDCGFQFFEMSDTCESALRSFPKPLLGSFNRRGIFERVPFQRINSARVLSFQSSGSRAVARAFDFALRFGKRFLRHGLLLSEFLCCTRPASYGSRYVFGRSFGELLSLISGLARILKLFCTPHFWAIGQGLNFGGELVFESNQLSGLHFNFSESLLRALLL